MFQDSYDEKGGIFKINTFDGVRVAVILKEREEPFA